MSLETKTHLLLLSLFVQAPYSLEMLCHKMIFQNLFSSKNLFAMRACSTSTYSGTQVIVYRLSGINVSLTSILNLQFKVKEGSICLDLINSSGIPMQSGSVIRILTGKFRTYHRRQWGTSQILIRKVNGIGIYQEP